MDKSFEEQRCALLERFVEPDLGRNHNFDAGENRRFHALLSKMISRRHKHYFKIAGIDGSKRNRHHATILHTELCQTLDKLKDLDAKYMLQISAPEKGEGDS